MKSGSDQTEDRLTHLRLLLKRTLDLQALYAKTVRTEKNNHLWQLGHTDCLIEEMLLLDEIQQLENK